MSAAEVLRRAAALMRERAKASETAFGYGPWVVGGLDEFGQYTVLPANQIGLGSRVAADVAEEDAEHIASWHPAVALAVADWLDEELEYVETTPRHKHNLPSTVSAIAVARAYLGESA